MNNNTSASMNQNAVASAAVNKLHEAKEFVKNSFMGGDQTPSAY